MTLVSNKTPGKRPPNLPPRCDSPAPGERLSTAYRFHLRSHPLKCPTCSAENWLSLPLIQAATLQTQLQCPHCKTTSKITEGNFRKLDILARVFIITFTLIVLIDFLFVQKKAIWGLDPARFLLVSSTVTSCCGTWKRPYLKLTPVPVQAVKEHP
jgi:hypothetical protein